MKNFIETPIQVKKPEKEIALSQKILEEADLVAIEMTDRNKDGLLLTPDGSISHYQGELYWKILKTDSFKKWFTDSVAVYKDNQEPLMVFHSTQKKQFKGTDLKLNEGADDWCSFGVYFSSSKEATINYYKNQYNDDMDRYGRLLKEDSPEKGLIQAEKEKYTTENEDLVKTFGAFVKITKPLELTDHQQLMELHWAGFNRQELLNEYDGIIISYDPDFSNQYIVFKEENILTLSSELR